MDHRLTARPRFVSVVDAYRYRLPLAQAARFGGREIRVREGLIVCLQDVHGNEGLGEAAPLPGFSSDSVDDAVAGLKLWSAGVTSEAPPSLGFAIDSAMADLEAHRADVPLYRFLNEEARDRVRINALVVKGLELEPEVERIVAGGYSAVKLKVGRAPIETDAAQVRRLRDLLPPEILIRLDANRAWSFAEASEFARAIDGVSLDYIEEPLARPVPEMMNDLGLPIALDETVREIEPQDLEHFAFARAVVLKPSLMGTLSRVEETISRASALNIQVVLSGAFEAGVGTRMLLALAAGLPGDVPCGFDPYLRLAEDVIHPRVPIYGGEVDMVQMYRTGFSLERARMHRIDLAT